MRRIVTLVVLTLAATTLVAPTAVSAEPMVPRLRAATVDLDTAAGGAVEGEIDRAELGEAELGAAELGAAELGAAELGAAEAATPGGSASGSADTVRTDVLEAPIAFSGIWAEVPDVVEVVRVRTATAEDGWSDWTELDLVDDDDGPDAGTAEAEAAARAGADRAVTEYLAVGDASHVQVELVGGDTDDLAASALELVDTDGLNEGVVERTVRRLLPRAVPAQASDTLPAWVRPRADWGAVAPKTSNSVASGGVHLVVVHHTAGRNGYSREEVPGILRGIQDWHMRGNGWNDVGYNAMVDRFGQVWEGRAGGFDRAVIGAHAANFNTGSFGVSVLGDYTSQQASEEALEAVARVIGWKADLHGFDTEGTTVARGATRPVVVGHRDVGSTACPGLIQDRLPQIRARARVLTTPFDDVLAGPHKAAISRLASRGYLGGYGDGRFGPEEPMSRAHMASALARAMGLAPRGGDAFSDVHPSSTHGGNIYALLHAGVTDGCATPGRFCPDATVTREQMASFVDRMLRR